MSITLGQVNSAVEAVQRELNTTLVESRSRLGQAPIANQAPPQQEENDCIVWFQDQEMGDNTMAEYSLMRTKKKKTRASNNRDKKGKGHGDKKTKRKKGHHDPGGSDDSSPSSSEDSDESGKKPSRKERKILQIAAIGVLTLMTQKQYYIPSDLRQGIEEPLSLVIKRTQAAALRVIGRGIKAP